MSDPTELRLIRSPLGRRLILIVLGCALTPILILGVLMFLEGSKHLRREAQQRLHRQTRATAMSLVERLLLVESSLGLLAAESISGTVARDHPIRHQLMALSVVRDGQAPDTRWGRPIQPPSLDSAAVAHLDAGATKLVVAERSGPVARLLAGRRADPSDPGSATLWAEISPTYLWGIGPDNTLPPLAELVVLDEQSFLVHSTVVPGSLGDRLRGGDDTTTGIEWQSESGETFIATGRVVPLETRYDAGDWLVSISRPRDQALGPLVRFRRMFPQVVALTVLSILLLGPRLVRRLLTPVFALKRGAERIAEGDFSRPVEVSSGDELEDLAATFNRMGVEVERRLAVSRLMATVGGSAMTDATPEHAARTLLDGLESVVAVGDAHVMLATSTGDWRRVEGSPAVPTESVPGSENDEMYLPLATERVELGWLTVTRTRREPFAPAEREAIRELSDHLALVLDHLDLRAMVDVERRRLATLVEILPSGVVVLDAERRIQLANRLGRELLPALRTGDLEGVVDTVGGKHLDALVDETRTSWHELTVESPATRHFVLAISQPTPVRGVLDPGGAILAMREVTAEREAESEARRQERLAAVGRLAAGIAHDFNNILQAISMATDLVHLDAPRYETELILQQCQRASEMIGRILDFSRDSPHRPTDIDVRPVVAESTMAIAATLPPEVEIETDLDPGPAWAHADATQVQQVVQNLLVNARDALTETDGGKIRVRLGTVSSDEARIAEASSAYWIRLVVTDTGPGIPEDVQPMIFEPFFTTKPSGAGTGLGLAQVIGIVEQHGGHVTLDTGESGTSFSVFFPPAMSQQSVPAAQA